MPAIRDRAAMIAGMDPALMPGLYQFCTLSDPARIAAALPEALGMFHEAEGLSLILPDQTARALGLPLACLWPGPCGRSRFWSCLRWKGSV